MFTIFAELFACCNVLIHTKHRAQLGMSFVWRVGCKSKYGINWHFDLMMVIGINGDMNICVKLQNISGRTKVRDRMFCRFSAFYVAANLYLWLSILKLLSSIASQVFDGIECILQQTEYLWGFDWSHLRLWELAIIIFTDLSKSDLIWD